MSSWFGGPAAATHKRTSDKSSENYHVERRGSTGGAFVRSHGKRSPSPKRYFVRAKSPSAQSTRSFSSIFGGKHTSSSSYYKRRPRDGFISRILAQIKRYLRDLIEYAKNNPMKVIMLVLPLVTGGALATVLKTVGIRLPAGIAGFMGAGAKNPGVGGVSGAGTGAGIEQAMNIAKMFL